MSNMRMTKYKRMIENINSNINGRPCWYKPWAWFTLGGGNTALALIYDYDKCNEYAKVIMDVSTLVFDEDGTDLWKKDYSTYEELEDERKRIIASKELVRLCRKKIYATEGYKFIFWALMILTVDKTDAEEHLALICDFAKMLRITEDEFEDIIQTIKIVYNELTTEYVFKSENIPSIFGSLFNMYDGQDIE